MNEKFTELLKLKNYHELKQLLANETPQDLAAMFSDVEEEQLAVLFRILPKEIAAETFVEMDSDVQELLIRSFSDIKLKEIFDSMFLDDTVDIIEEMPANVVSRILRTADIKTRSVINELLNYPEDSAGSIMTIEYVDLRSEMTVEEAIKRIRRTGVDKETIYTCYVTDDFRHLLGLCSVKDLLTADDDRLICDIMDTHVIFVDTIEDKELVANEMAKYGFIAMPVVDKEKRLLGIVTVDDAIDVMQAEVTEDIEKMAAITPSDKPYLKASVFETWLKRIPWLLLLMVSATFTGQIISSFESALAAQAALMAFIPMLMDTGGNAGSQSSVTIIRGLALNEIHIRDIFKILWKEIRVSLLCGLTLATANFVKILLVDNLILHNDVSIMVALVVCITLVATVIFAKIVGALLPLLAKQIGFDPAVMASPFITTIVDALSLIVYFNVAQLLIL
ncbi:MAG: magnesium transporter [Clostridia bacterium]